MRQEGTGGKPVAELTAQERAKRWNGLLVLAQYEQAEITGWLERNQDSIPMAVKVACRERLKVIENGIISFRARAIKAESEQ